jgi:hypothetical protein
MTSHRFPPPWSVEELDVAFVVRVIARAEILLHRR